MGVAYQLRTIGGTSSISMTYWVENLQLFSYDLSTKNTHEFERYKVTCRNGLEQFSKKIKSF